MKMKLSCNKLFHWGFFHSTSTGRSKQLSEENLAQSVSDALVSVSKAKLVTVQRKFSSLDTDHSGRITTEEMSRVLLNNQIFILGHTLTALVKKFEADGGGVLHERLMKYLLGKGTCELCYLFVVLFVYLFSHNSKFMRNNLEFHL